MGKAISMKAEVITWSSESMRGKRRSQYLSGQGAVVSTCMRGKVEGTVPVHCGNEDANVRRNRLVERGHIGLWVRVIMRTVKERCQIRVNSSCHRRAAAAAAAGADTAGVRALDKVLITASDQVLGAHEAHVDLMLVAAMRPVQLGERGQGLG